MSKQKRQEWNRKRVGATQEKPTFPKIQTEPDWFGRCENCGASPILPATGMCGPCTFGEADTADGNW